MNQKKINESNLISHLQRTAQSVKDLAERFGCPQYEIRERLKALKLKGIMLVKFGDKWHIASTPIVKKNEEFTYTSRSDNTFKFGVIGDTHLCSKYERLDVLNDLYDIFELEQVDRVFHQGNYVDGEARFNRHELKAHGIDDQISYLIKNYPQKSFNTYAVSGDDHEGWYAAANGIDIGRHVQSRFEHEGRHDWINCGFMECYHTLKNANTGKKTKLLSIHAGGGSSYAVSYRPQKIVESFQGGEKPGVLLIGHYHKLSYNVIRGVHTIQSGCTQDQTSFMRKKSIDAHVGGAVIELLQNPNTGTIIGCQVQFYQYFPVEDANNRWNYAGLVNLIDRKV